MEPKKITQLDIKDGKAELPMLARSFEVDRSTGIDQDTRTVPISFSSDTPYRRWFGEEILGHDPGEVDLDWFKTGNAPLLKDHDPRQQIGVVEYAEIKKGKGYAKVRFSRNPQAEEVFKDVLDGIIKNISVGYQVKKMILVEEKDEGPDIYRVTDWKPLEASTVSVPADEGVGVNRSGSEAEKFMCEIINKRAKEETTMEPKHETTPVAPAVPVEPKIDTDKIRTDAIRVAQEDAHKRVNEIMLIGADHNMVEEAVTAIKANKTVDQFKDDVLKKQKERQEQGKNHMGADVMTMLGLSQKEQEGYSLFRAIQAVITKDWSKAGFEKECSDAVEKACGKSPQGFYMPMELGGFAPQKRDLNITTTTAGGYLKGTDHRGDLFIQALYDRLVLQSLGCQVMTGLVGDLAIPAFDASVTVYWVAEAGEPTEGAPTLRQVAMAPKTVGAYIDLTRKLRLQASPSAEAIFRNDMVRKIAVAVDAVGIEGGATNEPTGILQTSGIGAVTIATNGGAPTWGTVVNLEREVAVDNADVGSLAYLTNPKVKSKLATTAKVSSTDSVMILNAPWNSLYGYPMAITNGVPSDLTKGGGSSLSALIFGNFNDLILGQWGNGVDILVDPYTLSASGGVRVTAFLDVDYAVRNPVSFAACKEIVTT